MKRCKCGYYRYLCRFHKRKGRCRFVSRAIINSSFLKPTWSGSATFVSDFDSTYNYLRVTGSGSLTLSGMNIANAELFLIGGGGGGGVGRGDTSFTSQDTSGGGGGSGGQVVYPASLTLATGTYTFTVGAGGTEAKSGNSYVATAGSSSSISGPNALSYTASGGNPGATASSYTGSTSGGSGGSTSSIINGVTTNYSAGTRNQAGAGGAGAGGNGASPTTESGYYRGGLPGNGLYLFNNGGPLFLNSLGTIYGVAGGGGGAAARIAGTFIPQINPSGVTIFGGTTPAGDSAAPTLLSASDWRGGGGGAAGSEIYTNHGVRGGNGGNGSIWIRWPK